MMKKTTFLLSFLTASALSASAQVKSLEPTDAQIMRQYVAAPETMAADVLPERPSEASASMLKTAPPQYTFANGNYYKRPMGTYYRSKMNFSSFTGTQLMVPPFLPITLTNMSPDKADSKWVHHNTSTNNGNDVTVLPLQGNYFHATYATEDGDLRLYTGRSDGGAAYFTPALKQVDGTDLFHLGYGVDYLLTMGVDSFMLMSLMDTGDSYTGFTDGVWMGLNGKESTKTTTVNGTTYTVKSHSLHQYYPRPLHPLCVERIVFQFVSIAVDQDADFHPFLNDGQLDVYVIGDQSRDTIAHMVMDNECVTQQYYNSGTQQFLGQIEAVNFTEDMFFNKNITPFVIDEPFYVVVSGFENDNVQIGFMQSSLKNIPWEAYKYSRDNIHPTVQHYWRAETNDFYPADTRSNLDYGYWQAVGFGSTSADRQYNMMHYLKGFFDVVKLNDSQTDTLTAPNLGGYLTYTGTVNGQETQLYGPQWKSARRYAESGSRVANYLFDGLPDWVRLERNIDTYWTGDNQWVNITQLYADPLPRDVSGRMATITITSEYGAKSEPITLIQGDITGIKTVDNEPLTTGNSDRSAAAYNLAGQRVADDYKGIIIQNGAKAIRK